MASFEFAHSEEDRIGWAAPPPKPAIASAASPRAKAGTRAAIDIAKTFAVLMLIAIGMLALRLLLSLPHGVVH